MKPHFFEQFYNPLPPGPYLHALYCRYNINDPSFLRPWRHLWTIPKLLKIALQECQKGTVNEWVWTIWISPVSLSSPFYQGAVVKKPFTPLFLRQWRHSLTTPLLPLKVSQNFLTKKVQNVMVKIFLEIEKSMNIISKIYVKHTWHLCHQNYKKKLFWESSIFPLGDLR